MTLPCKTLSILALALLGAARPAAQAQPVTITFGAQQIGSALGLEDGSALPQESLIRFGYFSIPLEQVAAGAGNPSLLDSAFIELAATRIGYFGGYTILDQSGNVVDGQEAHSPYDEAPGLFGHTLTYDPEAMGLMATRYFLWVVDAPELSGATQSGLFSDADWLSPSFGEATFDVSTVDPLNPADVFAADRGPEQSSIPGFGPVNKLRPLNTTPVPEPHLAFLLLAATATFGLRRRRPQLLPS
jgi:hypothetical protein